MIPRKPGPLRIAIIGAVVARHDAISNDIASIWGLLRMGTNWEVTVLAAHNELPQVPVRVVPEVTDLLLAREFLDADLLLYNFGIYHPLFDALLVGNGRARQAVVFQNITPAHLVPIWVRGTIERSFRQLHNLRHADRLWPASRENLDMLLDYGFDPAKIEIQPLAVERPARAKLVDKATTPIQVLFVGRIVPAKGVHDLLAAMVRLRGRRLPPLHLRVVGNMAQSDPAFRDELLRIIATNGLDEFVEFIGTVDDNECNRLLQEAHIVAMPSYHEGFCKPVIEGLRVGAIPVLYAAHNLRYIADGLCRTVPPGDVGALAESLAGAIEDAAAVAADPTRARLRLDRGHLSVGEFAEAAARHVDQFEPARIGTLLRERVSQLLAPPRE